MVRMTERVPLRRTSVMLMTLAFFGVLFALDARPAHAATFVVNSTDDSADQNTANGVCDTGLLLFPSGVPECTLRAAIEQANATSGADTINFNIPGSGTKTIEVGKPPPGVLTGNGELPTITGPVTIDGYTQPGATKNTENGPGKTNAQPLVELDGTDSSTGQETVGLTISSNASNSVIKGLVINRFESGIGLIGYPTPVMGVRIEGSFLGTDPSGTTDLGNGSNGVQIYGGSNNTVGDDASPEARNLISGNGYGVRIGGDLESTSNKVEGNLIGTQKDGTSALGNLAGVYISGRAKNNVVGGTTAGAANVVAFNANDGVTLDPLFNDSPTGNRILGNSIFSNGELGIELENSPSGGPTLNDADDLDTGSNNLQNFPVISSATVSGSQLNVSGYLDSAPSTYVRGKKRKKKKRKIIFVPQYYIVQFFSSPQADPSSHGEGKTFIGQTIVVTNLSGEVYFDSTFAPSQPVSPGETVAATATRYSTGDTSEFSEVEVVG